MLSSPSPSHKRKDNPEQDEIEEVEPLTESERIFRDLTLCLSNGNGDVLRMHILSKLTSDFTNAKFTLLLNWAAQNDQEGIIKWLTIQSLSPLTPYAGARAQQWLSDRAHRSLMATPPVLTARSATTDYYWVATPMILTMQPTTTTSSAEPIGMTLEAPSTARLLSRLGSS